MNPVTHFLSSWFGASIGGLTRRDRILVTLCGVLPDLDGLGVALDQINTALGREDTAYYATYHHMLLHGLPAAIVFAGITLLLARDRLRAMAVGSLVFHFHLLADLIGSRGPTLDDIWPIAYLAPFSDELTVSVSWQWQLSAWPNVLFTVVLLAMVFRRTVTIEETPLEFFGNKLERGFVDTVNNRWESIRKTRHKMS